eukprot:scaffold232608_cov18-Tisochrysis_lutea.AAC.1
MQALALPLAQHPVLHAISIAASGNVQGAIMVSSPAVQPSHSCWGVDVACAASSAAKASFAVGVECFLQGLGKEGLAK